MVCYINLKIIGEQILADLEYTDTLRDLRLINLLAGYLSVEPDKISFHSCFAKWIKKVHYMAIFFVFVYHKNIY